MVEFMYISLFFAYFPRFYPSTDGVSICLQLKKKFKDPLIIVKLFIMLKATGMEKSDKTNPKVRKPWLLYYLWKFMRILEKWSLFSYEYA